MIAFELNLNGQRLFTAGVGSHGVLSAIVGWTLRDAELLAAHPPDVREEAAREDLRINIGGLTGNTHYHWPTTPLKPGDEITIHVCETTSVDPPADTSQADEILRLDTRQDYVRRMCREWGWHLTEQ
jgi:hypothetical protein